jgi:hypothetical protein
MRVQHAFYGFIKEVKGVREMDRQPLELVWKCRVSARDAYEWCPSRECQDPHAGDGRVRG